MEENYLERRAFKRYAKSTEFVLTVEGTKYDCRVIDYSADGLCLQFLDEGFSIDKGKEIEITIEDPDVQYMGQALWTKKGEPGLIVGFSRIGNIKGTCQDFRLADLLIGLQRKGKTGLFEIITGSKLTKIFFKNGDMIFASSTDEDDRFGEVLLKQGRITLQQYFEASKILRETGKRLGNILIEQGYLKPYELANAVRHQVVEIIVNLLPMECGYFEFVEKPLPTDEAITLQLSAANIIYQGVKRMTNFQYILQDFPYSDEVISLSEDPMDLFQDLSLSEEDKQILSSIDGKRSISDIIAGSVLTDFEVLKTLYAFLSARIVVVRRGDEPPPVVTSEEIISEPMAEIDAEFVKIIEDKHASCESSTHYEFLGINETDSEKDIKKAYFKMAKEFHPDRHFSIQSEDIKQKLNDISTHINVAHDTLSDPERRKEYDEKLAAQASGPAAGKPGSPRAIARESFDEGRSKMTMGQYEQAEELFARAIHLDDTVATYHYYHGLALFKMRLFKEATRAIENAVQLESENADYAAELGFLYLKLGFKKRAESTFKKALDIQPFHEKAIKGMQESTG